MCCYLSSESTDRPDRKDGGEAQHKAGEADLDKDLSLV